jgi:hypothetical protein
MVIKSCYEYYRVIKKLLRILQGDQKVVMNITGRTITCYKYYRVIKKLVWILQGNQRVATNITGWSKIVMNITGWSKVVMNITGWSKICHEYYRVNKKLIWILQGDQKLL